MIEYIKGAIDELLPTTAIVEAGGIGYQLIISLNTYTAIQGKKEAKLYVYEVIREDAHQLYGFYSKKERELFSLLVAISGIGGQTARMILSAFTPSEFASIVESDNVQMLKSVKGIGPKAAQRIIVEMKGKISIDLAMADAKGNTEAPGISRELVEEAVAALTMLGFPPAPSQKVVYQILKEKPAAAVEQIIKQALTML